MNTLNNGIKGFLTVASFALALLITPRLALAHCDTLDGPVVSDARTALADGNVTPVLKWVKADDEPEIRKAFEKTLSVRNLDAGARDLADIYFFETLVRVHRAGEGAPYTGLKAAGAVEPVVARADLALEQGNGAELAKTIAAHVEKGILERFGLANETKKHANDSVDAGRKHVEAYVTYVHYVEGIAKAVHGGAHHGEQAASGDHQH